jgi:multidrug efflux system outer membrane protein
VTVNLGPLALAFVWGCAVGPDYVPPEPVLPDAWHIQLSQGLESGESSLDRWWTSLDDPALDDLIQRATAHNLDLRFAVANVLEARARRGEARGRWFPTVDALGSYSYNRATDVQVNPSTVDPGPATTGGNFDAYNLGLDASWEVDVFGRIRRLTESADASLTASVEDYRDVLVILYAEVAINYVQLRAFQARLLYALSNAESQRATLKLTRDRSAAGLAPDLDVRQAELNLASTEAFVPFYEERVARAIHRLGVLVGQHPSSLYAELAPDAPIPTPPESIAVGIPADLMRRRPDIRAAERRVAAQSARIGVETAELYPRFHLLGTFSFSAADAAKMFTGGAGTYSLGPAVIWNVFDGGRIRSRIRAQDARTEGALAEYENTILIALEEVENSLVAYTREVERRDALARSVVAAQESVELVRVLYLTGLTNFQNVLDTERSLFQQQDRLAESEGLVVENLIALYRALGGGWDPEAADATAEADAAADARAAEKYEGEPLPRPLPPAGETP